jgi:maltooligosyltrehalose trehalohydrolase
LDWSELEDYRHSLVLGRYQQLARLRRTLPELTDPSFSANHCTADQDTGLFRLRRGAVEILVNFGAEPQVVEISGELLFATNDELTTTPDDITLPPHAGAMVRTD